MLTNFYYSLCNVDCFDLRGQIGVKRMEPILCLIKALNVCRLRDDLILFFVRRLMGFIRLIQAENYWKLCSISFFAIACGVPFGLCFSVFGVWWKGLSLVALLQNRVEINRWVSEIWSQLHVSGQALSPAKEILSSAGILNKAFQWPPAIAAGKT